MGKNQLHLKPSKRKWLWASGPPGSGFILSLTLSGLALPQTELWCNLEVLLDMWFLLKEQIISVTRQAFAQTYSIHQLHPILDQEALLTSHSCLGHFPVGLSQNALYRAAIEDHPEVASAPKHCRSHSIGHSTIDPCYAIIMEAAPAHSFFSKCNWRCWLSPF